jgi:hypothetical protein
MFGKLFGIFNICCESSSQFESLIKEHKKILGGKIEKKGKVNKSRDIYVGSLLQNDLDHDNRSTISLFRFDLFLKFVTLGVQLNGNATTTGRLRLISEAVQLSRFF